MYHQFNIQEFYVLPTQCICVFRVGFSVLNLCYKNQPVNAV